jgi:hypothetical protein
MKTHWRFDTSGIAQAPGKGHCPVCAVLKDYRSVPVEDARGEQILSLCSHHAWYLAKSSPDYRAARLPPKNRQCLVAEILNHDRNDLKEDLNTFLEHLEKEDPAGWGVLGRAAGFLTSQREILQ